MDPSASEIIDPVKKALQEERKQRKLAKKLKKMELGANQRDESKWPKCVWWIANRARFCSGERVEGSKYCINHIHLDNSSSGNTKSSRRRVVCPVDPSHTVFEDKLEKHIKVCNKSKEKQVLAQCPYFVDNFNQGDGKVLEPVVFSTPEEKQYFEQQLASKIRSVYNILFPEGIPTIVLRPSSFDAFISDKSDRGATADSLRHLYQQVSMISHMKEKNVLTESPVYIEFGAGRGMLSLGIDYCLNGFLPTDPRYPQETSKGKYLMIDMSPVRFKADRWLRHKESDFLRLTGNIRDIDLQKVPIFEKSENRQIVGIAKHLCGVATDYTIRCILNSVPSLEVQGVCIATCCHHRCQWHSFVGREIYCSLGFSEGEWDYIRRLTSWATNVNQDHSSGDKDKDKDDDDDDNNKQMKCVNEDTLTFNSAKIEYLKMDPLLGRMCKRIIDYCRARYIEDHINELFAKGKEKSNKRFKAELMYYCQADDSPENCLILGYIE